MQVADRVGQRPIIVMGVVAIIVRLRNTGRDGRQRQDGGSSEKLQFGHLNSPKNPAGIPNFGRPLALI